MGKAYYGVPNPDTEDGEYYYDYEPILTERNEQAPEEAEVLPQHIIIFVMALPFLPIWSALAIMGSLIKISYFESRNPEKARRAELELAGFFFFFVVGVIMYCTLIPALIRWAAHVQ